MTMQPPTIAKPTFAYFLGRCKLARRRHIIDDVKAHAVKDFELKHDAAIESLGLAKEEPLKRFQVYLNEFPNARWQELANKFPYRFDEMWADFEGLKERAFRGDWS